MKSKTKNQLRAETKVQARGLKSKIIVIVGPTASGKSELAVKIAKKIDGEIISADSRQVYRGLDIGTAKVPRDRPNGSYTYRGVPHHCIDFVSPKKVFTAAEFKKCAQAAIADITQRGKTPILVGGTGFWVDAVVYDLRIPEVPPNPKLRRKLSKKSVEELFKILQKLDPRRAKTIEQKNPRRLIRAIEIAGKLGRVPPLKRSNVSTFKRLNSIFWLGLNPPQEALRKNIEKRAQKMVKRGLVEETKKLLRQGVSKKRIREFGFEYRAALDYIENRISKAELYERIVRGTLEYARKQMRWFRRNPEIHWKQDRNILVTLVK